MRTYAQIERDALCDAALRVGPDAPTLCDGWTVRDLMAHLAMRERRLEAAGVIVPQLAAAAEHTRRRYALRPFTDLVDMVRNGPHELSFFRIPGVDARANLSEYFVHHEDILRAGDTSSVRVLEQGEQDALHAMLAKTGRLLLRGSRFRVAAHCPGQVPLQLNSPNESDGDVVIVGLPSEVVLYLTGRTADVTFEGDPDVVNRFADEPKGL